jgi:hypothetical protein
MELEQKLFSIYHGKKCGAKSIVTNYNFQGEKKELFEL